MQRRCKFCAKKLNVDGYCENQKCPENLRRQIIEREKQKKKAE